MPRVFAASTGPLWVGQLVFLLPQQSARAGIGVAPRLPQRDPCSTEAGNPVRVVRVRRRTSQHPARVPFAIATWNRAHDPTEGLRFKGRNPSRGP